MKRHLIQGIVIAAVVLPGVYWWLGSPPPADDHLSERRSPKATTSVANPELLQGSRETTGSAGMKSKGALVDAARFRAGLATAPNLRVFVKEALSQPEDGGHYYAIRAMAHCQFLPTVVQLVQDKKQAGKETQKQRLRKELERCDGVEAQFGGLNGLLRSIQADRERDPLRVAYTRINEKTFPGPKEAIDAALASGDAALLHSALLKYSEAIIDESIGKKLPWPKEGAGQLVGWAAEDAQREFLSDPLADWDATAACLVQDLCGPDAHAADRDFRDANQIEALNQVKKIFEEFLRRSGRASG